MPAAIVANGVTLHHSIQRPILRELFRMGLDSTSSGAYDSITKVSIDRPAALKSASAEDVGPLITEWIALQVSHVLGLDETDIQVDKPLHAHGIDSLVAVDMKNWFFNDLGKGQGV